MPALLEKALKEFLACPVCRSRLEWGPERRSLRCSGCAAETQLVEGIPVFAQGSPGPQEEEKRFRDDAAQKQLRLDSQDLLAVVGRHHCLPVMRERAQSFRGRFSSQEWILDVGTGYAWPWKGTADGPPVVGIDFSLGNLLLARKLLGQADSVLLLCADAARLPIADGTVSGVWSAQAFQHFPDPTFRQAQEELDRVLKKEFRLEFHHLNPALLVRVLCRMRGKRLHRRGRCGPFETYRLSLSEWRSRWASFRKGQLEISTGYSELFFHPELGVEPWVYPAGLERLLVSRIPALAGNIARQGVLRIENRKNDQKPHELETVLR